MIFRASLLFFTLVLSACVPNQPKPISLTILQPHDGDTIHTNVIPLAGLATVGATVHVSGSLSDTGILLPVNDTGYFAGQLPIEDLTGLYSAVFRVTKSGSDPITQSVTVYYLSPAH